MTRAPLTAAGTTAHVLVIHPDRDLREIMHVYLLGAGYVVSTAADGPEASAKLRGRTPDLIALDTDVKELDGVQFIFGSHECREQFIPVLFLTDKTKVAARAERLGFAACHTAPLSAERFLAAAARCVRFERAPRFSALRLN